MSGYLAYWGVPDFGPTIRRPRVEALVAAAGRRLRLLSAPSGWGKTVAAAQYAQASGRRVLWVDAYGSALSRDALCEAILRCAAGHSSVDDADSTGAKTLPSIEAVVLELAQVSSALVIVLDDVALNLEDLAELGDLQHRLSMVQTHIVVTSKSAARGFEKVCGVSVVGVDDLRLTRAESDTLAELSGFALEQAGAQDVIERSDGHVALHCLIVGLGGWTEGHQVAAGIGYWVSQLLESEFTATEVAVLEYASLLMHGRASDLLAMWGESSVADLQALAQRFPLLRVGTGGDPAEFTMHDSAVDALGARLAATGDSEGARLVALALPILEERGDHGRSAELLVQFGTVEQCSAWLSTPHADLFESANPATVQSIIERVPLHTIMGQPRAMCLWADVLGALGDDVDAIAKARAACHLAEFESDQEVLASARVTWVDALCRLQRFEEAARLACRMPIVGSPEVQLSTLVVRATVMMYVGDLDGASEVLAQAQALGLAADSTHLERYRLSHMRVILDVVRTGEYWKMIAQLSALLPQASRWSAEALRLRGNLALGLMETGRLERSLALVSGVLGAGVEGLCAQYGVVHGGVLVAQGACGDGLRHAFRGVELGCRAGREADTAGNRTVLAVMLRACGQLDESLAQCERAYERLCSSDYMRFRSVAALEIGASLLSMRDIQAARRWVEAGSATLDGNNYNALRAAMILAECDRLEGSLDSGVSRIAEHREHVLSESSNWQIAMYIRAFPSLLGMFAAALGASALPVHMLRMILPENAEAALDACRGWLDKDEWRNLGRRVLGPQEFARAERRGGEPACRVRVFGGLDVSLGQRSVAQRDWRKRKARLLFAMLVAKRGQEVPRELVLEHLWPEFSEERARNNFYVAWSAMKSALMGQAERGESCPYLENRGGRLRIVTESVRSDLDEFEEALAEARQAESDGEADRALDAYSRLSYVYRGDLLPGDLYDDWFSGLRDRCRLDFADAMMRAADLLLERDDPCEALAYARRALQVEPLREDIYQSVMRCSIAAGQRNGAIDTFLQCRTRLADDLGLDPSAETMALYQQILVMEDRPRYDDFGLS